MADPKEAVKQQRVIKHMNADHQDSLARYLEHFSKLSSYSARNARLEAISLQAMTISSSKGVHHLVPFSPPLASWSDIRERVGAMDKESLKKLNRSDVTVKRYILPNRIWQRCLITLAVSVFVVFSRRSNLEPGAIAYDTFAMLSPAFAQFCAEVRLLTLYGMTGIHVAEAFYMAIVHLPKYNVRPFAWLWFQWTLSCFVEGVCSFRRIKKLVQEERKVKKKAQR
jgi:hypothetical protein